MDLHLHKTTNFTLIETNIFVPIYMGAHKKNSIFRNEIDINSFLVSSCSLQCKISFDTKLEDI